MAYGGEGYKSRLQVTRCQGGWPNGLESGFGLCHGNYSAPKSSSWSMEYMTRMGRAIWLSIILIVTISDGSFVEEDSMVV